MNTVKIGSLFDGIGGTPLSAVMAGAEPVWASEIEKWPISITKRHFQNMKHYGDITQINGAEIEPVDIIVGGSPCQDLSVAGKRAGLDGERSGLFMDQCRIIKEMRGATKQITDGSADLPRPRYMVWENVPGAFSSNKGEDFRAVLEEIARIADDKASIPGPPKGKWLRSGSILGDGYSIAWRTVDAQFWGVPQRRRRIYLVADFGGSSAPKICFKPEGVSGNSEASGEAWKGTAGDADGGTGEASGVVSKGNGEAFLMREKHMALTCGGGQAGQGYPCVLVGGHAAPEICFKPEGVSGNSEASGEAWKGTAGDAEGGTGTAGFGEAGADRCNCLTPWDNQSKRIFDPSGSYPTLQAMSGGGANNTAVILRASELCLNDQTTVCYGISSFASNAMKSSNPHSGVYVADTSRTIDQNGGNPACNQGGIAVVELEPTICRMVAFGEYATDGTFSTMKQRDYKDATDLICYGIDCRNFIEHEELYPTLQAKSNGGQSLNYSGAVRSHSIVRRLTPLECERLQGYPDNWTKYDEDGREISDSQRYKALGNSFAVPNAYFFISRCVQVLQSPKEEEMCEQSNDDSRSN